MTALSVSLLILLVNSRATSRNVRHVEVLHHACSLGNYKRQCTRFMELSRQRLQKGDLYGTCRSFNNYKICFKRTLPGARCQKRVLSKNAYVEARTFLIMYEPLCRKRAPAKKNCERGFFKETRRCVATQWRAIRRNPQKRNPSKACMSARLLKHCVGAVLKRRKCNARKFMETKTGHKITSRLASLWLRCKKEKPTAPVRHPCKGDKCCRTIVQHVAKRLCGRWEKRVAKYLATRKPALFCSSFKHYRNCAHTAARKVRCAKRQHMNITSTLGTRFLRLAEAFGRICRKPMCGPPYQPCEVSPDATPHRPESSTPLTEPTTSEYLKSTESEQELWSPSPEVTWSERRTPPTTAVTSLWSRPSTPPPIESSTSKHPGSTEREPESWSSSSEVTFSERKTPPTTISKPPTPVWPQTSTSPPTESTASEYPGSTEGELPSSSSEVTFSERKTPTTTISIPVTPVWPETSTSPPTESTTSEYPGSTEGEPESWSSSSEVTFSERKTPPTAISKPATPVWPETSTSSEYPGSTEREPESWSSSSEVTFSERKTPPTTISKPLTPVWPQTSTSPPTESTASEYPGSTEGELPSSSSEVTFSERKTPTTTISIPVTPVWPETSTSPPTESTTSEYPGSTEGEPESWSSSSEVTFSERKTPPTAISKPATPVWPETSTSSEYLGSTEREPESWSSSSEVTFSERKTPPTTISKPVTPVWPETSTSSEYPGSTEREPESWSSSSEVTFSERKTPPTTISKPATPMGPETSTSSEYPGSTEREPESWSSSSEVTFSERKTPPTTISKPLTPVWPQTSTSPPTESTASEYPGSTEGELPSSSSEVTFSERKTPTTTISIPVTPVWPETSTSPPTESTTSEYPGSTEGEPESWSSSSEVTFSERKTPPTAISKPATPVWPETSTSSEYPGSTEREPESWSSSSEVTFSERKTPPTTISKPPTPVWPQTSTSPPTESTASEYPGSTEGELPSSSSEVTFSERKTPTTTISIPVTPVWPETSTSPPTESTTSEYPGSTEGEPESWSSSSEVTFSERKTPPTAISKPATPVWPETSTSSEYPGSTEREPESWSSSSEVTFSERKTPPTTISKPLTPVWPQTSTSPPTESTASEYPGSTEGELPSSSSEVTFSERKTPTTTISIPVTPVWPETSTSPPTESTTSEYPGSTEGEPESWSSSSEVTFSERKTPPTAISKPATPVWPETSTSSEYLGSTEREPESWSSSSEVTFSERKTPPTTISKPVTPVWPETSTSSEYPGSTEREPESWSSSSEVTFSERKTPPTTISKPATPVGPETSTSSEYPGSTEREPESWSSSSEVTFSERKTPPTTISKPLTPVWPQTSTSPPTESTASEYPGSTEGELPSSSSEVTFSERKTPTTTISIPVTPVWPETSTSPPTESTTSEYPGSTEGEPESWSSSSEVTFSERKTPPTAISKPATPVWPETSTSSEYPGSTEREPESWSSSSEVTFSERKTPPTTISKPLTPVWPQTSTSPPTESTASEYPGSTEGELPSSISEVTFSERKTPTTTVSIHVTPVWPETSTSPLTESTTSEYPGSTEGEPESWSSSSEVTFSERKAPPTAISKPATPVWPETSSSSEYPGSTEGEPESWSSSSEVTFSERKTPPTTISKPLTPVWPQTSTSPPTESTASEYPGSTEGELPSSSSEVTFSERKTPTTTVSIHVTPVWPETSTSPPTESTTSEYPGSTEGEPESWSSSSEVTFSERKTPPTAISKPATPVWPERSTSPPTESTPSEYPGSTEGELPSSSSEVTFSERKTPTTTVSIHVTPVWPETSTSPPTESTTSEYPGSTEGEPESWSSSSEVTFSERKTHPTTISKPLTPLWPQTSTASEYPGSTEGELPSSSSEVPFSERKTSTTTVSIHMTPVWPETSTSPPTESTTSEYPGSTEREPESWSSSSEVTFSERKTPPTTISKPLTPVWRQTSTSPPTESTASEYPGSTEGELPSSSSEVTFSERKTPTTTVSIPVTPVWLETSTSPPTESTTSEYPGSTEGEPESWSSSSEVTFSERKTPPTAISKPATPVWPETSTSPPIESTSSEYPGSTEGELPSSSSEVTFSERKTPPTTISKPLTPVWPHTSTSPPTESTASEYPGSTEGELPSSSSEVTFSERKTPTTTISIPVTPVWPETSTSPPTESTTSEYPRSTEGEPESWSSSSEVTFSERKAPPTAISKPATPVWPETSTSSEYPGSTEREPESWSSSSEVTFSERKTPPTTISKPATPVGPETSTSSEYPGSTEREPESWSSSSEVTFSERKTPPTTISKPLTPVWPQTSTSPPTESTASEYPGSTEGELPSSSSEVTFSERKTPTTTISIPVTPVWPETSTSPPTESTTSEYPGSTEGEPESWSSSSEVTFSERKTPPTTISKPATPVGPETSTSSEYPGSTEGEPESWSSSSEVTFSERKTPPTTISKPLTPVWPQTSTSPPTESTASEYPESTEGELPSSSSEVTLSERKTPTTTVSIHVTPVWPETSTSPPTESTTSEYPGSTEGEPESWSSSSEVTFSERKTPPTAISKPATPVWPERSTSPPTESTASEYPGSTEGELPSSSSEVTFSERKTPITTVSIHVTPVWPETSTSPPTESTTSEYPGSTEGEPESWSSSSEVTFSERKTHPTPISKPLTPLWPQTSTSPPTESTASEYPGSTEREPESWSSSSEVTFSERKTPPTTISKPLTPVWPHTSTSLPTESTASEYPGSTEGELPSSSSELTFSERKTPPTAISKPATPVWPETSTSPPTESTSSEYPGSTEREPESWSSSSEVTFSERKTPPTTISKPLTTVWPQTSTSPPTESTASEYPGSTEGELLSSSSEVTFSERKTPPTAISKPATPVWPETSTSPPTESTTSEYPGSTEGEPESWSSSSEVTFSERRTPPTAISKPATPVWPDTSTSPPTESTSSEYPGSTEREPESWSSSSEVTFSERKTPPTTISKPATPVWPQTSTSPPTESTSSEYPGSTEGEPESWSSSSEVTFSERRTPPTAISKPATPVWPDTSTSPPTESTSSEYPGSTEREPESWSSSSEVTFSERKTPPTTISKPLTPVWPQTSTSPPTESTSSEYPGSTEGEPESWSSSSEVTFSERRTPPTAISKPATPVWPETSTSPPTESTSSEYPGSTEREPESWSSSSEVTFSERKTPPTTISKPLTPVWPQTSTSPPTESTASEYPGSTEGELLSSSSEVTFSERKTPTTTVSIPVTPVWQETSTSPPTESTTSEYPGSTEGEPDSWSSSSEVTFSERKAPPTAISKPATAVWPETSTSSEYPGSTEREPESWSSSSEVSFSERKTPPTTISKPLTPVWPQTSTSPPTESTASEYPGSTEGELPSSSSEVTFSERKTLTTTVSIPVTPVWPETSTSPPTESTTSEYPGSSEGEPESWSSSSEVTFSELKTPPTAISKPATPVWPETSTSPPTESTSSEYRGSSEREPESWSSSSEVTFSERKTHPTTISKPLTPLWPQTSTSPPTESTASEYPGSTELGPQSWSSGSEVTFSERKTPPTTISKPVTPLWPETSTSPPTESATSEYPGSTKREPQSWSSSSEVTFSERKTPPTTISKPVTPAWPQTPTSPPTESTTSEYPGSTELEPQSWSSSSQVTFSERKTPPTTISKPVTPVLQQTSTSPPTESITSEYPGSTIREPVSWSSSSEVTFSERKTLPTTTSKPVTPVWPQTSTAPPTESTTSEYPGSTKGEPESWSSSSELTFSERKTPPTTISKAVTPMWPETSTSSPTESSTSEYPGSTERKPESWSSSSEVTFSERMTLPTAISKPVTPVWPETLTSPQTESTTSEYPGSTEGELPSSSSEFTFSERKTPTTTISIPVTPVWPEISTSPLTESATSKYPGSTEGEPESWSSTSEVTSSERKTPPTAISKHVTPMWPETSTSPPTESTTSEYQRSTEGEPELWSSSSEVTFSERKTSPMTVSKPVTHVWPETSTSPPTQSTTSEYRGSTEGEPEFWSSSSEATLSERKTPPTRISKAVTPVWAETSTSPLTESTTSEYPESTERKPESWSSSSEVTFSERKTPPTTISKPVTPAWPQTPTSPPTESSTSEYPGSTERKPESWSSSSEVTFSERKTPPTAISKPVTRVWPETSTSPPTESTTSEYTESTEGELPSSSSEVTFSERKTPTTTISIQVTPVWPETSTSPLTESNTSKYLASTEGEPESWPSSSEVTFSERKTPPTAISKPVTPMWPETSTSPLTESTTSEYPRSTEGGLRSSSSEVTFSERKTSPMTVSKPVTPMWSETSTSPLTESTTSEYPRSTEGEPELWSSSSEVTFSERKTSPMTVSKPVTPVWPETSTSQPTQSTTSEYRGSTEGEPEFWSSSSEVTFSERKTPPTIISKPATPAWPQTSASPPTESSTSEYPGSTEGEPESWSSSSEVKFSERKTPPTAISKPVTPVWLETSTSPPTESTTSEYPGSTEGEPELWSSSSEVTFSERKTPPTTISKAVTPVWAETSTSPPTESTTSEYPGRTEGEPELWSSSGEVTFSERKTPPTTISKRVTPLWPETSTSPPTESTTSEYPGSTEGERESWSSSSEVTFSERTPPTTISKHVTPVWPEPSTSPPTKSATSKYPKSTEGEPESWSSSSEVTFSERKTTLTAISKPVTPVWPETSTSPPTESTSSEYPGSTEREPDSWSSSSEVTFSERETPPTAISKPVTPVWPETSTSPPTESTTSEYPGSTEGEPESLSSSSEVTFSERKTPPMTISKLVTPVSPETPTSPQTESTTSKYPRSTEGEPESSSSISEVTFSERKTPPTTTSKPVTPVWPQTSTAPPTESLTSEYSGSTEGEPESWSSSSEVIFSERTHPTAVSKPVTPVSPHTSTLPATELTTSEYPGSTKGEPESWSSSSEVTLSERKTVPATISKPMTPVWPETSTSTPTESTTSEYPGSTEGEPESWSSTSEVTFLERKTPPTTISKPVTRLWPETSTSPPTESTTSEYPGSTEREPQSWSSSSEVTFSERKTPPTTMSKPATPAWPQTSTSPPTESSTSEYPGSTERKPESWSSSSEVAFSERKTPPTTISKPVTPVLQQTSTSPPTESITSEYPGSTIREPVSWSSSSEVTFSGRKTLPTTTSKPVTPVWPQTSTAPPTESATSEYPGSAKGEPESWSSSSEVTFSERKTLPTTISIPVTPVSPQPSTSPPTKWTTSEYPGSTEGELESWSSTSEVTLSWPPSTEVTGSETNTPVPTQFRSVTPERGHSSTALPIESTTSQHLNRTDSELESWSRTSEVSFSEGKTSPTTPSSAQSSTNVTLLQNEVTRTTTATSQPSTPVLVKFTTPKNLTSTRTEYETSWSITAIPGSKTPVMTTAARESSHTAETTAGLPLSTKKPVEKTVYDMNTRVVLERLKVKMLRNQSRQDNMANKSGKQITTVQRGASAIRLPVEETHISEKKARSTTPAVLVHHVRSRLLPNELATHSRSTSQETDTLIEEQHLNTTTKQPYVGKYFKKEEEAGNEMWDRSTYRSYAEGKTHELFTSVPASRLGTATYMETAAPLSVKYAEADQANRTYNWSRHKVPVAATRFDVNKGNGGAGKVRSVSVHSGQAVKEVVPHAPRVYVQPMTVITHALTHNTATGVGCRDELRTQVGKQGNLVKQKDDIMRRKDILEHARDHVSQEVVATQPQSRAQHAKNLINNITTVKLSDVSIQHGTARNRKDNRSKSANVVARRFTEEESEVKKGNKTDDSKSLDEEQDTEEIDKNEALIVKAGMKVINSSFCNVTKLMHHYEVCHTTYRMVKLAVLERYNKEGCRIFGSYIECAYNLLIFSQCPLYVFKRTEGGKHYETARRILKDICVNELTEMRTSSVLTGLRARV
ncbi:mucin-19-like [Ornithodoros turicata]|uniref:mucin-19-like n=1 Tax=Ornithodoros turicata TaxID=34597 RepID=UPI00313A2D7F